jgi:NADPH:quinone reductase-like Zn-dependent oxidoreductase
MQELDKPVLQEGEVLVKVHAVSINPVDIKTRKGGALFQRLNEQPPVILGWDISGEVVEVAPGVTRFREGDAVFGMVNFPGAGKAYADYVAAPADHLALKPDNISHSEAAASTLAALTSYQVLIHEAGLKEGQNVLVHAAAGGVGHFAVQIARHFGATVSGTASAPNAGFLKELGVRQVIDYTKERFEEKATDVDIILDPVGGETTILSLQALRKGGILISIVGGVKDLMKDTLERKGIRARNYLVHSSGADMEVIARLLQEGSLKPHVSQEFSFDQMAQAQQQIETGRTRGKVVINMDL